MELVDLNAKPILNIETDSINPNVVLDASDCWIISMPYKKNEWISETYSEQKQNTYNEARECYDKEIKDAQGQVIPKTQDFWTPFPADVTLTENNFGGTITKLDAASSPRAAGDEMNTAVKIQASKIPDAREYKMKISGFQNPFSKLDTMQFVMRHYPKCANLPNDVNENTTNHSPCKDPTD